MHHIPVANYPQYRKYYQNHTEAAQSEEEKYNSCLFHYHHATMYGNNYINK
jgi:hypothetical protein